MCVCALLDYLVERSSLWPIVIRKLFAQLSLNPYSVHGGSKSKEEGGWVGNGQQEERKRKKINRDQTKYRPHRPQPNQ